MGVDTKGFLFGENRDDFSLEKLIQYMSEEFDDVKIHSTHREDYKYIEFVHAGDHRVMNLFIHYDSYMHEGYPEINQEPCEDDYIVLFDLSSYGKSVEIIEGILKNFGGGYIIDNDCGDDWMIVVGDYNKTTYITTVTKIMCLFECDEKEASKKYADYLKIKDMLMV